MAWDEANFSATVSMDLDQLFLRSRVSQAIYGGGGQQLAFISVTCSLVSSSFLRPVATRSLAVTSCLGREGGRDREGRITSLLLDIKWSSLQETSMLLV